MAVGASRWQEGAGARLITKLTLLLFAVWSADSFLVHSPRSAIPSSRPHLNLVPQSKARCTPMMQGSSSDDGGSDFTVQLRVYDIGGEVTPMLSALLRKEMEAIWHVGVAAYGKEYWFSTHIESKMLGETAEAFGMVPKRVYDLGITSVPQEVFERHLEEVMEDEYNIDTYRVFTRNCNHFANDAIKYLTGGEDTIPDYVLEMSDNALSELPAGQAWLTEQITNQVARVVMLAWGRSTRSKEQRMKREAREARKRALQESTQPSA